MLTYIAKPYDSKKLHKKYDSKLISVESHGKLGYFKYVVNVNKNILHEFYNISASPFFFSFRHIIYNLEYNNLKYIQDQLTEYIYHKFGIIVNNYQIIEFETVMYIYPLIEGEYFYLNENEQVELRFNLGSIVETSVGFSSSNFYLQNYPKTVSVRNLALQTINEKHNLLNPKLTNNVITYDRLANTLLAPYELERRISEIEYFTLKKLDNNIVSFTFNNESKNIISELQNMWNYTVLEKDNTTYINYENTKENILIEIKQTNNYVGQKKDIPRNKFIADKSFGNLLNTNRRALSVNSKEDVEFMNIDSKNNNFLNKMSSVDFSWLISSSITRIKSGLLPLYITSIYRPVSLSTIKNIYKRLYNGFAEDEIVLYNNKQIGLPIVSIHDMEGIILELKSNIILDKKKLDYNIMPQLINTANISKNGNNTYILIKNKKYMLENYSKIDNHITTWGKLLLHKNNQLSNYLFKN